MLRTLIRTFIPTLFLTLSLCVPAAALAQDDGEPAYCATLSQESCALLTRSQEAMASLTAATTAVDFTLNVSNVPDVPFETLTLEFAQNLSYSISNESVAAREQLQQQLLENAAAGNIAPKEVMQSYIQLLNGMKMDAESTLTLSDDLVALIQEAMESESQLAWGIPNTLQLRLRMIDGAYYVNLSDLSVFLPVFSATGDIWLGVDWAPLMEMAMRDAEFETMTPQEAEIFGQVIAGTSNNLVAGPLATSLASTPITVDALSFLEIERLTDSVEDGRDVAQFRTTVDYNRLLADPMAQALLAEMLRDGTMMDQQFSEQEIGQMIEIIQFAGPPLLQSLGLEAIETIDLESGYLTGSTVRMDWDLSQIVALATSFGGADLDMEEVPVVSWSAVYTNSNFNEPIEVAAPDTALLLSLEELMLLAELE